MKKYVRAGNSRLCFTTSKSAFGTANAVQLELQNTVIVAVTAKVTAAAVDRIHSSFYSEINNKQRALLLLLLYSIWWVFFDLPAHRGKMSRDLLPVPQFRSCMSQGRVATTLGVLDSPVCHPPEGRTESNEYHTSTCISCILCSTEKK